MANRPIGHRLKKSQVLTVCLLGDAMLAAIQEAVMSDWFNNIDNETINISDLAKSLLASSSVQD